MSQIPATSILMVINLAVFTWMLLNGGLSSIMHFPGELLLKSGGNYGPFTLSGEYWRLITAGFVHGSLIHIALNLWCLWSLGQLSERLFGSSVTFAIYMLTGVGGALLSVGWNPERLEVGASGAVFGIAGAILSGIKFGKVSVSSIQKRQIFCSLIFFVIFNLSFGMMPGIDNMCHLGGLITGILFGAPLATAAASGKKALEWGTVVLASLVLAGLGSWAVQTHGHRSQLIAGQIKLEGGNIPGAISVLQRAALSEPKDSNAHILLGKAYEMSLQRDLAIGEYQSALQLNPTFPGLKEHIEELQSSKPPDKDK
jgi:rhomboid protease GluP